MYFRLRQLPLWLLLLLWGAIISMAALVFIAPAKAGQPLNFIPAPTLIWQDNQKSAVSYIRGLTKNNTVVTVTVNGRPLLNLQQRRGRAGVASFAVPWPPDLPPGMYEVVATAKVGSLVSQPSQPVLLVVPGTVLMLHPFACKA